MKTPGIALFLLFFSTFIIYGPVCHGWAGLVAALLWTAILLFGLGAAIMGEGALGGLVGVIGGWMPLIVITTSMALFEWYIVGNRAAAETITDDFCRTCFCGRVIAASYGYVMWVYGICTTEHPYLNLFPVVLCVLGVIAGLVFKIISRG